MNSSHHISGFGNNWFLNCLSNSLLSLRASGHILLVIVLNWFAAIPIFGQASGRMETDRPDQAECASVVKAGYIQAELGFNANQFLEFGEWNVPTALIKYGIADKLELRYISVAVAKNNELMYRPDAAGVKVFLFKEKGWLPQTTIIAQYRFDDTKRDNSDFNRTGHSVGELIFTCQNNFTDRIGLGYNFGPEFHSDGTVEWIYRVTPGMNLGSKYFIYGELFGRMASEKSELWTDAGIARYLSDDLKIDFSAGFNLGETKEWYTALGISWRFNLARASTSARTTFSGNPQYPRITNAAQ